MIPTAFCIDKAACMIYAGGLQTAKKPVTVKIEECSLSMSSGAKAKDLRIFDGERILRHFVPQNDIYGTILLQSCLLRKDFDFHRNSRPTVPLYADRRELLGFRNFFNSLPVCRKWFFDTL